MKVTLFLDKDQGDTLEVKNKICSVLKPDHIIFDHWDGELLNNIYVIRSKDHTIYRTRVNSQEAAIVDYVGYCNGDGDEKIFYNYSHILTYDQLIATFNNKYCTRDGDKILSIEKE